MGNLVGRNIKFLRKSVNLSQCGLAGNVGLKRGNIASYENGSAEPRLENLIKIADFFNIRVDYLLCKNLVEHFNNKPPILKNGIKDIDVHKLSLESRHEIAAKYLSRADQYKTIINGLHNCHCYRMDNLDVNELPKGLQRIALNHEELLEVAEVLLKDHLELLAKLKEE